MQAGECCIAPSLGIRGNDRHLSAQVLFLHIARLGRAGEERGREGEQLEIEMSFLP